MGSRHQNPNAPTGPASDRTGPASDRVSSAGDRIGPAGDRIGPASDRARPAAGPAQAADQPWPQPIRDGRWTDSDGVDWHIRGSQIEPAGPALRRLLNRPGLRVLHVYGPEPVEPPPQESEALLARIRRSVTGEAPPHSAFRLAEFRNDERRAMLVIEEAC